LSGNKDKTLYINSVSVRFDTVNRINVRILVNVENESLVAIKVNGTAYTLSELISAGNGSYVLVTDAIAATAFDDLYRIELLYDGEALTTLEYSVNAYAHAMCNGATANEKMQALALALYRYGVSANAYLAEQ